MKKIFIAFLVLLCPINIFSQSSSATNTYNPGNFLGYNASNGSNPLFIKTNNVTRMTINGATGATAGFVGINTVNPLFQVHVTGTGTANAQGWTRGVLLSNSAALMWEGAPNTGRNYFMAHSSASPLGDFYQGYSEGMGASASVTYASKVYVTSTGIFSGPLASTHIFKWLVVQENNFERRFAVNTLTPTRIAEIKSNMSTAPQLRITTNNNAWADFQTLTTGNLDIQPQGGKVGINLTTDPTANLDVNGTARIRNVQTATPNSILVGVNASGANDVHVRRLDFSGNPNEALLGDGTWGAISSGGIVSAANGCWVNATNEVEWGTNPLLHNTTLHLAQNNLLFKTFPNETGVVTFGGTTLGGSSRVIVNNDTYTNGLSVNSISPTMVPIKYGINASANNANRLIAVSGNANTGNSVVGVNGTAIQGIYNTTGVRAFAASSSTQSVNIGGDFSAAGGNFNENNGVRGYSEGSLKNNFGGKFKAGTGGSLSIGVYGECAPDNPAAGLVGYAAYFSGGVVTTGGTLWPSDSSLKHNITPLDEFSDSLMQLLTPVSYEYNQVGNASRLNLSTGTKFGFLAQQVEQYFPGAVREVTHPAEYDSLGNETAPQFQYKAVDMSQLIPVMMSDLQRKTGIIENQSAALSAMDEVVDSLESQVEDLNNRLSQLENCLSGILPYLCQLNQSAIQANTPAAQEAVRNNLNVTLSNRNTIILDQNVPNPFAEQTVINFSIPETVKKAQIHFYNEQGKLMESVDLVDRGLGSITVFGSDLSSGVYTYTLVADGQVVATKKMMKQ